jgi:hypothetical protein
MTTLQPHPIPNPAHPTPPSASVDTQRRAGKTWSRDPTGTSVLQQQPARGGSNRTGVQNLGKADEQIKAGHKVWSGIQLCATCSSLACVFCCWVRHDLLLPVQDPEAAPNGYTLQ